MFDEFQSLGLWDAGRNHLVNKLTSMAKYKKSNL